MPCALLYDVPADVAMYRRVRALIGDAPPDGLIAHTVVAIEGGLRHFEVWQTRAQFDRFHGERVEPAVHAILREVGLTEMPPDPPVVELDLVDHWAGEPARFGDEARLGRLN
jgi:hypothetical protein